MAFDLVDSAHPKSLTRLVRNGHSIQLTISRPLAKLLQWKPNQALVMELLGDGRLVVRRPELEDLRPTLAPAEEQPLFGLRG